jgi:hypothetical protein
MDVHRWSTLPLQKSDKEVVEDPQAALELVTAGPVEEIRSQGMILSYTTLT